MTTSFNFRKQCLDYWNDIEVYENIMEMFDLLPVACDVNGKYLCMHGGMSAELTSLPRINRMNRKREPENEDMLLDLLWADPAEDKEARGEYFKLNHERACSVYFGEKPVENIMNRHGLVGIVRAHTCVRLGYQKHRMFGKKKEAPVTTLFSAPNYCGKGNLGAYALTSGDSFEITQFDQEQNKPYLGKGTENAFAYFMVDVSAWLDEFIYVLFDYLEYMDQDKSKVLERCSTRVSIDDKERQYFDKVSQACLQIEGSPEIKQAILDLIVPRITGTDQGSGGEIQMNATITDVTKMHSLIESSPTEKQLKHGHTQDNDQIKNMLIDSKTEQ